MDQRLDDPERPFLFLPLTVTWIFATMVLSCRHSFSRKIVHVIIILLPKRVQILHFGHSNITGATLVFFWIISDLDWFSWYLCLSLLLFLIGMTYWEICVLLCTFSVSFGLEYWGCAFFPNNLKKFSSFVIQATAKLLYWKASLKDWQSLKKKKKDFTNQPI